MLTAQVTPTAQPKGLRPTVPASTARAGGTPSGTTVTALAGTPIEIAVYKVGDKYVGARSNEFGYANYEITQAPKELSPLR